MTRVHRGSHAGVAASTFQRARVVRKRKPYKILLEHVTQEKKKLHSALSYDAHAPIGYSFVPAGTPELTEYCKELCRKRGLVAHIVSAKPKNRAFANPDKIAHHVHRIGHHFPNEVVDQACDWLGYTYRGGVYVKSMDSYGTSVFARSLATHGDRMGLHDRPVTIQETNQQIKAAIRDLFPKMPDEDVEAIVKHAFREGTKRVGNAQELPLARRVQLAVVAHIRHEYTNYDQLLKTGSWMEARQKVEESSLDQLRKWRGEEENGAIEMEETFREVIVLDDDDDDDEDDDDSSENQSSADDRERSLEIFSSQAAAHDLQPDEMHDAEWTDITSTNRAPGKVYFLRPRPRRVRAIQPQPVGLHASPREIPKLLVEGPRREVQRPLIHSSVPPRPIRQAIICGSHALRSRGGPPYENSQPLMIDSTSRNPTRSSITEPSLRYRDEQGRLYTLQPIERPSASSSSRDPALCRVPEDGYRPHRPVPAPILKSFTPSDLKEMYSSPHPISLTSREQRPMRNVPRERLLQESDVAIPSIERDIPDEISMRDLEIAPRPYGNHIAPDFVGARDSCRNQVEQVPAHNGSRQFVKRKSWPSPRRETINHLEPHVLKRQKPAQPKVYYKTDPKLPGSRPSNVVDLTSSPQKPHEKAGNASYSLRTADQVKSSRDVPTYRLHRTAYDDDTQSHRKHSPSVPKADVRHHIPNTAYPHQDGSRELYQDRPIRRYVPDDQLTDVSYS